MTDEIEQQGLSGRYKKRGEDRGLVTPWLDVTLMPDDAVCAPRNERSSFAERPWVLQCIAVKLAGVTTTGFACRFPSEGASSPFYGVGGVIGDSWERPWVVLSSGRGLVIEAQSFWTVGSERWTTRVADSPVLVGMP